MDRTVCELFAGVGGFRLGLEDAGYWRFVWANQWEPGKKNQYAFDCYNAHFGNSETHVNKDIGVINKASIPDHNLLVGGFPCQDYSVARTGAQGIQGKKGVLWWQIRDILIAKRPPFVLLENVDRLLKSPAKQRGRDFGVILACFNELGYSVEWRVINAADYGFAQRRRRIFIFAYKNNTQYYKRINRLESGDLLHKYGFFQDQFPIEETIRSVGYSHFNSNDIFEISEHFKFGFMNSGIMCDGKIHTEEAIPISIAPTTLAEIIESDVDARYFLNGSLEKWQVLKGSKKIERVTSEGFKYIFSEGNMVFPDPLDKPARTMLTSESTVNRSSHVICDPETGRLRLLTPVETERVNGFRDNWTNTGMPLKFRYFCMGNALVVDVIRSIGKTLNRIFESEK